MKHFKVIFVLFSIFVAAAVPCDIACTKEMNPVCATDGVNFEMFSNECLLNTRKCRDGKSWTKTDVRSCLSVMDQQDKFEDEEEVPCIRPCPLINAPICGFNGENYQLFSNTCMMQNGNCLVKNDQFYKSAPLDKCTNSNDLPKDGQAAASQCADSCLALYNPICGYNGNEYKIFGNSCAMKSLNCIRSEAWQNVPFDLCPSIADSN